MDIVQETSRILTEFRAAKPVTVHCILSNVAEAFTAQTLLALGGMPSMTHDVREVADYVENCKAVLIQLSTFSDAKEAGVLTAIDTAKRLGKPWLLNPRSADKSAFRRELGRTMALNRPKTIIGRPLEISALARSSAGVELRSVSTMFKTTCVRISKDVEIKDTLRASAISGAHGHSDTTIGMDTAMGVITAAFCTIEMNGFLAATAGALICNIATDLANKRATGPGSFDSAFLDALYTLKPEDIAAYGAFILPVPAEPAPPPAN